VNIPLSPESITIHKYLIQNLKQLNLRKITQRFESDAGPLIYRDLIEQNDILVMVEVLPSYNGKINLAPLLHIAIGLP